LKVAIVGSVISGLTSASYLAQKGYEVTLFEHYKRLGGVTAPLKEDGFI
jgi:phytoene dehydrogenase-like protein